MTQDAIRPSRLFLTTCPDEPSAESLARALVERRLAACVNIVPGVRSFYRWEGEIHDDGELLLLIKTAASVDALRAAIDELHPYDVPELAALEIADGSPAYLRWVAENSAG